MKEHLFTAVLIILLTNYWKIIYENGFIIATFLMNSILWIIFFIIIILLSIIFIVFGYLFTNTGEKTHLSSEKVKN
jgi:predicted membrane protein